MNGKKKSRLSVFGNRSVVVAVEIRPPRAHLKIGPLADEGKIAFPFENLPL